MAIKPKHYGSNKIKFITNKNFFIPAAPKKKSFRIKTPSGNKSVNFF